MHKDFYASPQLLDTQTMNTVTVLGRPAAVYKMVTTVKLLFGWLKVLTKQKGGWLRCCCVL